MNEPKALEVRRKELKQRLRTDPTVPPTPQFTDKEMKDAAARVMAAVFKSKPHPPQ